VIILDMFMPNMDGAAFQRALKADPRWAKIPVVIFSAFPPAVPGDAIGVVPTHTTPPRFRKKRRLCTWSRAPGALAEPWKAQRETIRASVMVHHATHSHVTRVPFWT
jgi:hypothetical protein